MMKSEMKHGPHFEMWVIGAAAGLVAAAAMVVVGDYGWMAGGFVGAMIAAVVAFVFGLPQAGPAAMPVVEESPEEAPVVEAAVAAAPVAAAPVAAAPAVAEPVALVSQPVPRAKPAKPAKAKPAKPAKAKAADGPARLSGPRKGKADDLKEIEGIGPAMEKLVNEMGFFHFDQIAGWSDADVAWVDSRLKNFKGRIVRDRWIAQAKLIVAEGVEAFRIRAKTNNY
jgi:predicted flap endonuclease-1-like 5' DNA nuclease